MEKITRGGVLVLLAAALVLTGCSSDDDDDDGFSADSTLLSFTDVLDDLQIPEEQQTAISPAIADYFKGGHAVIDNEEIATMALDDESNPTGVKITSVSEGVTYIKLSDQALQGLQTALSPSAAASADDSGSDTPTFSAGESAYLYKVTVKANGDISTEFVYGTTDNAGDTETTLPTAVVLNGYITSDKDTWTDFATMTETSSGSGIWEATVTINGQQWPNFCVKATISDSETWYSKGGKITIDGDAVEIGSSDDNLWFDAGSTSAAVKITVDFTGTTPTVKVESVSSES